VKDLWTARAWVCGWGVCWWIYLRLLAHAFHGPHHYTGNKCSGHAAGRSVQSPDGRSPIMSCNDFSRVGDFYLLGRPSTPTRHAASSSPEAAAAAATEAERCRSIGWVLRQRWRRLQRQNALTRASVKLSDKLVDSDEGWPRFGRPPTATPYWYSAASGGDNWATCAWMSNVVESADWRDNATRRPDLGELAAARPATNMPSVRRRCRPVACRVCACWSYLSNINFVAVFRRRLFP